MDNIQITWEVSDGYVGGSRPQYTNIETYDIDSHASREDIEELIEYWVSEDFKENIYPSIQENQMQRAIDQVMEALAKRRAEEEDE